MAVKTIAAGALAVLALFQVAGILHFSPFRICFSVVETLVADT